MREASRGVEKLVAIETRLTNSACNTKIREPTELEPGSGISLHCAIPAKVCGNQRVNRARVGRAFAQIAQNYAVLVSEFVRNWRLLVYST